MFKTKAEQLALIAFIFLLVFIPVLSFLISQRMRAEDSQAQTQGYISTVSNTPQPTSTPNLRDILGAAYENPSPAPDQTDSLSTYGPTLSFAVSLEGRPENEEQSKMFIGIAEGQPM